MSLYTPEVKKIITEAPWPKGVQYDVFEHEICLYIVFYQDNLDRLHHDDKEQIKTILLGRLPQIQSELGIPILPALEPTRK